VRLVLFALLNGALVPIEIAVIGKALNGLLDQVAIGHGMADTDNLVAHVAQDTHHAARRLALARPGADGAHSDDGLGRLDHSRIAAHQAKVCARGERRGGLVHHSFVRDIAVGKHDLVNF
jgi:hypothetical protein